MAYDRLVMLDDIGRVFTFKSGRVISGGFLVGFSSGLDIVTSGGNFGGYVFSEVLVDAGSVGSANFIGIALQTVGSELPVAVLMEGIFVLPAGATNVIGGQTVQPDLGAGTQSIVNCQATNTLGSAMQIGRALSSATASTGFCIVKLW